MVMTRKEYLDAGTAARQRAVAEAPDGSTHEQLRALGDEASWKIHEDYFAQFVTDETIAYAARIFGAEKLLKSKDRSFNDIKVNLDWSCGWRGNESSGCYSPMDVSVPFDREALWEAHGSKTSSNSDIVCILKQAARMWVEKFREEHG